MAQNMRRINLFAVVPLFLMIITVANSRFSSDAIDPTLKLENPRQIVDGRVTDNTLQQNFVFAIASLTLATVVPTERLQVVWACGLVFFFARLLFWIGYRIHPLYRAPGMSATAYLNLGMILYGLYAMFLRT